MDTTVVGLGRSTDRRYSRGQNGNIQRRSSVYDQNDLFSPDSQRVFFQSDKDGKAALYRVQVERFVEKTESDL